MLFRQIKQSPVQRLNLFAVIQIRKTVTKLGGSLKKIIALKNVCFYSKKKKNTKFFLGPLAVALVHHIIVS